MPIKLSTAEVPGSNRVFDLCRGRTDPVFITREDGAEIVVMDMSLYRREMAAMQAYAKISEGEADVAAGNEQDAFRALTALRERARV